MESAVNFCEWYVRQQDVNELGVRLSCFLTWDFGSNTSQMSLRRSNQKIITLYNPVLIEEADILKVSCLLCLMVWGRDNMEPACVAKEKKTRREVSENTN